MARKGKSERSRHERKRAQKPTILIVVEGETEKLYFCDIKHRFRARRIEVEKPNRNDSGGIVLAARKKKELEGKGLSVEPWGRSMRKHAKTKKPTVTERQSAGRGLGNTRGLVSDGR